MGSKRSKISRASKRSKISRGSKVDIISNLPDSLLLIILSLLPLKSAVQTSVLSKRWRPLYMSLSTLLFSDTYGWMSEVHFMNFVERLLMHRPLDLNIEQFGLECQGDHDPTRVNHWIRKALEHQVKDLTLCFCFIGGSYELLSDIYTYGSFETLILKRKILVDIPKNFSFSRLKVLEFCRVTFSSYESVKDLLLNCPVLEDLVIEECKPLSGSCLAVCGSALKILKLKDNERVNKIDTQLDIVIDTPGLEALEIGDYTWADIFIESTLLSLRTAHIDVGIERMQFNKSVFRLLDNIYHVKFLTLTDKAIGALDGASDYHFPTFHNLIQLELCVEDWACWDLLPNILASSPNLQNLLLPWGVDLTNTLEECYGLCSWPRVVPECLSSHLKTIEIGTFHGTDEEMSLVEYLLRNGRVLRKIWIIFSLDCLESGRMSRIRKKLVSFGRRSKTCKIILYN